MENLTTQQSLETSNTLDALASSSLATTEAASGIPMTVSTELESNTAPVVPITMAVANQIRQRVEAMAVSRQAWEIGAYARSNELLYGLIKDCYVLYKELTAKADVTRDKRRGLDDYISLKGFNFKEGTPLTGKIIRCVFEGTDRRRLSTYHTVLRVAVAQNWNPEEFAKNISEFGGVQAISLGKASGAMTAKQKAEAAKVQVLSKALAKASSDALSKVAKPDGIGSKAVALMTQEADGSFTIHAVVRSDTAVNAALAAYFSSHKEEIKVAVAQTNINAEVASREAFIDNAAQAVING